MPRALTSRSWADSVETLLSVLRLTLTGTRKAKRRAPRFSCWGSAMLPPRAKKWRKNVNENAPRGRFRSIPRLGEQLAHWGRKDYVESNESPRGPVLMRVIGVSLF